MKALCSVFSALLAFAMTLASSSALSMESYPSRPIRLLIGFPPGAAMDSVARPFAAKLSALLGQPVVVENRPGAAGTVSSAAVARAPADGYTLGIAANGDLVIAPHLMKVDYNPVTSFSLISLLSREDGFVLLAHPSFPANNVEELVQLARAKPGAIHYGSPGVGVPHHIAMEQFKKAASLDMVHVPFKGGTPLVSDLVGGQILLGIGGATAAPLVKGGKLKAIAVTADKRIAALPEVGTFAESGYSSVQAGGWFALIGPAGLSSATVGKLNAAARAAVEEASFNERLSRFGMRPESTTSTRLAEILHLDLATWGRLIRDTGIKVD